MSGHERDFLVKTAAELVKSSVEMQEAKIESIVVGDLDDLPRSQDGLTELGDIRRNNMKYSTKIVLQIRSNSYMMTDIHLYSIGSVKLFAYSALVKGEKVMLSSANIVVQTSYKIQVIGIFSQLVITMIR